MNSQSPVLALARELITRPSVTPEDVDCQKIIGERLSALGFSVQQVDRGEVKNLWATWGQGKPCVLLAGHTDVVPTGPVDQWEHPPFAAAVDEHWLHGRGAADMKASLAAMVVACERLIADANIAPEAGQIAFLITSDEEGPAIDGTRYVIEWLRNAGIVPEFCIVGEPSSSEQLGDVVRNGRRGSLNARLTVHGTQGHVAYPDLADNPIHRVVGFLDRLRQEHWDDGNEYYPPTSLQISNLHSGTGATNVIPGTVEVDFNLRFCTEQSAASIQTRVDNLLAAETFSYELDWNLSGEPFLTPKGTLTNAVADAIFDICGRQPQLSTSGGTSDGRFIATLGTQVVELGPVNATIHKIDERVAVADLEPLAQIYQRTLSRLRS